MKKRKKINNLVSKVVRCCKKHRKMTFGTAIGLCCLVTLLIVCRSNEKRAKSLVNEIFTCVALVEGDKGADKAYYCGSRWTVAYGVTVKPDGSLIKKGDKVSKRKAKRWAIYHIRKNVIPYFKYFERRMSKEQIIGTALFIYNVGGTAVTGYNINGIKVGNASCFLKEFNSGASPERCANCMTGFRRQGGKRANGLLKRHWVQGAIFTGNLKIKDVLKLKPTHFYCTKNLGNYYHLNTKRNLIVKDEMYCLRYDDTTLNAFFAMNLAKEGEQSVRDILPS